MVELIDPAHTHYRLCTDKERALRQDLLVAWATYGTVMRPSTPLKDGSILLDELGIDFMVAVGHCGRAVTHGVLSKNIRGSHVISYSYTEDSNAVANYLRWA